MALPTGSTLRASASRRTTELTYWTLAQQDGRFIHQHAVDAYEAQHAGGKTRPITGVFGLIGLYLAIEKRYTGRQVQLAHMKIASRRKDWPRLEPPARKGRADRDGRPAGGNGCGKGEDADEMGRIGMGDLGGQPTLDTGGNPKDALS